jgi:hypothetical protein
MLEESSKKEALKNSHSPLLQRLAAQESDVILLEVQRIKKNMTGIFKISANLIFLLSIFQVAMVKPTIFCIFGMLVFG